MKIRDVLLTGLLAISLPALTKETRAERQYKLCLEKLTVLEDEYKEAFSILAKDDVVFEKELVQLVDAKNIASSFRLVSYFKKISADINKSRNFIKKFYNSEFDVRAKNLNKNLITLKNKISGLQTYKAENSKHWKSLLKWGCLRVVVVIGVVTLTATIAIFSVLGATFTAVPVAAISCISLLGIAGLGITYFNLKDKYAC